MKIDNLKIFTGRAHPALAQSICKELSMPLGNAVVESFPDSETFVKIIDHIRGDDVFIIQPTSKPSNESVMELLIMIDAARRASAKRITAVLPFFGYARQDRKDQPRVPITAKLIANLLVAAGANRVLTLDLHATQIQGFFDIPCDHLYASPVIYDYLEGQSYINNLTVFSPDVGGLKRAQSYATLFDCPLGFIAKRRISAEVVEATSLVGEVEGRDILIVDDMTETAGTLTAAAKILKSKGAKSVRAAVTHAILTETAYDRLSEHWLDELIITDSTPPNERYKEYPITVLPIGHLLTEAILRIHNNMSVTSLFKVKGF
ncbi:MAG TPA: ribose-phosphate pyrophosphokinase [Candidatus Merdousia gallistercoris]|nr:ribose-phosphate pyrophosphokinase [Candidatus Merdousia gallistercoris]